MNKEAGLLYIATGQRFLAEAEMSARSAKLAMPDIPIVLASDCKSDSAHFDMQIKIENPAYSFIDKILALKKTPFDKTIYLDADTFVLSDVTDLFNLLNRFDLAAAFEPGRFLDQIGGIPACFSELNTGVILYKSVDAVFQTIDEWYKLYAEEIEGMRAIGKKAWHDQYSFTKAIFERNISFYVLPPEYNARILLPMQASGEVKIVHSRLKNPPSYATQLYCLNAGKASVRLFNPNPRRLFELASTTLRLFNALNRHQS
jgi:hypothetical protein